MKSDTAVYAGEALATYHFGESHPFGPLRYHAFWNEFLERKLDARVNLRTPITGVEPVLDWFHDAEYIQKVKDRSAAGSGFLDQGDTPATAGIYEASCVVVATVLQAVDDLMTGPCKRAFVPIAGLHHASRSSAAGFCVFNDCGIAVEVLRRKYGVKRVAYVDIDAHHGDGVFYAFEEDPDLIFADLHEDGRYLYPGTGKREETGKGAAVGSKLNIPLPPEADDQAFFAAWPEVEALLEEKKPQFIILQCGADSLNGDPITHLRWSSAAHAHAATRLCALADRHAAGRVLALGGGGYNLENIAAAWCAVVQSLVES